MNDLRFVTKKVSVDMHTSKILELVSSFKEFKPEWCDQGSVAATVEWEFDCEVRDWGIKTFGTMVRKITVDGILRYAPNDDWFKEEEHSFSFEITKGIETKIESESGGISYLLPQEVEFYKKEIKVIF
jgi:hypothetical protein